MKGVRSKVYVQRICDDGQNICGRKNSKGAE